MLTKLQTQQNKFLRLISGLPMATNLNYLQKELTQPPLEIYLRAQTLAARARMQGSQVWQTTTSLRTALLEICPKKGVQLGAKRRQYIGSLDIQFESQVLLKKAEELVTSRSGDANSDLCSVRIKAQIKTIQKQSTQKECSKRWNDFRAEQRSRYSYLLTNPNNLAASTALPAALDEEWGDKNLLSHKSLDKGQSHVLLGLKTGTAPLRAHLHSIKVGASGIQNMFYVKSLLTSLKASRRDHAVV